MTKKALPPDPWRAGAVAHPRCSLPRCDVEGERDDARRHSEALRVLVGRVLDEVRPGDGGLGRARFVVDRGTRSIS